MRNPSTNLLNVNVLAQVHINSVMFLLIAGIAYPQTLLCFIHQFLVSLNDGIDDGRFSQRRNISERIELIGRNLA